MKLPIVPHLVQPPVQHVADLRRVASFIAGKVSRIAVLLLSIVYIAEPALTHTWRCEKRV